MQDPTVRVLFVSGVLAIALGQVLEAGADSWIEVPPPPPPPPTCTASCAWWPPGNVMPSLWSVTGLSGRSTTNCVECMPAECVLSVRNVTNRHYKLHGVHAC